jgi:hypothetical protein
MLAGLFDAGTLRASITLPTSETISGMLRACKSPGESEKQTVMLPFEIYTQENI